MRRLLAAVDGNCEVDTADISMKLRLREKTVIKFLKKAKKRGYID